jgi:3-oxoacyl-[acyl-carrier-protein] synthase-3
MDVNAACSGFIYSLALAGGLLTSGTHERILIVGADVLSHHINLDDPVTAPLFGDGAGAVVLEKSDSVAPMAVELGADGEGAQHVIIPAGGSCIPTSPQTIDRGLHWIRMAGREVYRSAVRMMSSLGENLGNDGFELLIAHQANRRILIECAEQLGVPEEKLFVNIDKYGNTSAASIPIAICEAWETGRLSIGDRLLLLAFGAGYTWAGAKLQWTLPPAGPALSTRDPAHAETTLSGVPS